MNEFTMILGDDTRDGHGFTATYTLASSVDLKTIQELNAKMVKNYPELDFSVISSDYEDFSVSQEAVETMKSLGVDVEEFLIFSDEDQQWSIEYGVDTFLDMWISCMIKANKDCLFTLRRSTSKNVWSTRWGYGVLS